ncbi:DUF4892 domain-containing protein [Alkalimarinus alittae]|uniref:DUF4892 domain-containing protein n=1 Tax=Alkalimarinus alittae TaxID=2961619 RepID=A0ABY6N6U4_9ALTE|nr:DUF4892 domain-containing protein [Alkalimarinus alittae]UZE97841.1 DUF4892 domain-containing protein [Alkalimarinus alittae]
MNHQNGKGLNMVVKGRVMARFIKLRTIVLFIGVLGGGLAQFAFAQELAIKPYAHSSLSESGEINDEDYLVPLSVPRRVNNQLRIEKELRVDVTGVKDTHRINEGHTTQQAFDHYLSQIKQLGGKILYQCSSRDCGRSSNWAQNIFNISKLYGEDGSQFYMVSSIEHNNQQWLVSVYAVERGNRRVYAHVETLKLNTALSSDLAPAALTDKNPLFIFSYGLNGIVTVNPTLAEFNKIISLSQANPDAKIYVIGYLQKGYTTTQEAIERSTNAADQVSTLLQKRGINASKITVMGVGPLVPFGQGAHSGNRVEVLVLDK